MELRPYQNEAVSAIFNQWNNGFKNTLLVLPTGTGKTVVFSKVVEEEVKASEELRWKYRYLDLRTVSYTHLTLPTIYSV